MQIPLPLPRYLAQRRCILFVGAGLSAAAGLPTWGALLTRVVEDVESMDDPHAPELRTLLNEKKYLDVADHCAETQAGRLQEILAESVRGDTAPIPEVHKALLGLPFAGIVTTNYDKLLERAYASGNVVPKVVTHASTSAFGTLLFDRSFFILKAHGDIDEPGTIVLSTKDYRELIHANPAFNSLMSAILLNFSILFAGYSLNDPDFRLLIERQLTDFQGNAPARYALMAGVGTVEAQILQRNAGIRVISYPKDRHEHVLTFFQELKVKVAEEEAKRTPVPVSALSTDVAVPPEVKPRTAKRAGKAKRPRALPEPGMTAKATKAIDLRIRQSTSMLEVTLENGRAAISSKRPAPDWTRIARIVGRTVSLAEPKGISTVGRALRACMSKPILDALAHVDEESFVRLTVDPQLRTVPWEWATIGGQPLCLAAPVIRSVMNARALSHMRLPAEVLVVGDPHKNLPGAAAEGRDVANLYDEQSKVYRFFGSRATFTSLVDRLQSRSLDILHFAGHAWVQNGEGYLYLAETTALGARDLRAFFSQNPPAIIFLNSHYTAFVPIGLAVQGVNNAMTVDERAVSSNVFGFMEMAEAAGVGAFIGCIGSPDDAAAQRLGVSFHRELLAGSSVARALWRARVETVAHSPDELSPLLYVGSGYGELRGLA